MTSRKTITIGDVSIPLDSYAIGGTALLGIRSSGKTYCAKGIAEQLLEHRVPIIVFDPIGVWRHLKAPAGKGGKGYPVVVAGGRGADLPLTPQSAQEIVRAAMRENIPLVIDLYDRALSKADWRRIVQTCFRTLLYENEGVRHIFLEEAAEYVPQKVMDGETYAEVEKLVRMGGNASLGITLINQRAQEVNKAVLDLCENLVLMRQMGAHAIDALEKWIDKVSPDFAKQIAAGMPKMLAGEAWVFAGGAEKPVFTRSGKIRTFHPDRKNPDVKVPTSVTDTSTFVEALQRALPALAEQQAANDPKKLKTRIAELEGMLRKAATNEAPTISTAALDEQSRQITELMHENRALEQHRDALADAYETLKDRVDEFTTGPLLEIDGIVERARNDLKTLEMPPFPAITKPSAPARAAAAPPPRAKPAASPTPRTNGYAAPRYEGSLGKGERAVLTAIAQHEEGVDREQITILTGYKRSTRDAYVQRLQAAGLVDVGPPITVTVAGLAALPTDFEPLPTGEALREHWLNRLPQGERAVFAVLIDAYPSGVSREEITERTAYKRSTRDAYLQRLATRKLIATQGAGVVVASEQLFG